MGCVSTGEEERRKGGAGMEVKREGQGKEKEEKGEVMERESRLM